MRAASIAVGLVAAPLVVIACTSFSSPDDATDGGPDAQSDTPATETATETGSDGGCVGTACTALVENEQGVSLVAVVGKDVYWGRDSAIRWCGDPCSPDTVAPLTDPPAGLVADDTHVYWAAGTVLAAAPLPK
jgi:hypothetical protein